MNLRYNDRGDGMRQQFLITSIHRVIFVDKEKHPEKVTAFQGDLRANELIFHFSGRANVRFNGMTLKTQPNSVRFLPKGENREYIVEKEEPGECIDVFFETDVPVAAEAFVMNVAENSLVGGLFRKLLSTWVARDDGYYFESIALLYRIFAQMQKRSYIPERQYQAIRPALAYIETHFLVPDVSVEAMAQLCGISYSYLKQIFIRKFGMPPGKYIIQLKINYACDLLRSGLYTVSQTAERCGFESVAFFSRQFKAYAGVSPSAYMREVRQKQ